MNETMKTTIDRATFTITFRRSFAAPREDVFDAWTDPEQITHWWDPTGTPGTTRMTVTIRCASAEHLEQFVALGVDKGTDRTFDNLVSHVARQKRAS